MSGGGLRVIVRKELADALRRRWLHLYAGALGILGVVIAWYATDATAGLALQSYGRTAASLTNLCLLLAPLVALVMGADVVAGERDRGTFERLLAQPLGRGELLAGKFLGLLLSLTGATVVAFVPAGVCLALLTGSPPPLAAAVFPLVAVLVILPMLALGLLLSVTADSGAKALARAVLLWAWLVLLYDLLLLGTLMTARLGTGFLIGALAANPVHLARLLVVLTLEPDLYLLGPAGALLTETLSPAATVAVLVFLLLAWTAAALAAAFLAFRIRRPRSRRRDAPEVVGWPRIHDPGEGIMKLASRGFGRVRKGSAASSFLLLLLALPVVALVACGGGPGSAAGGSDGDDGVHRVDAELLARGGQLYQDNCAPCHGATGKGDGVGSASFNPRPRDHTDRAYMDTLSDETLGGVIKIGGAVTGFPNMPSHPHLGGDDLVALVAYVRSLSRGPDGVEVVELDVD
ncbi:MAG TPA: ABC transporter permease subunit [Thermoanaerobaculia bacterium]|nr:ABC transporter permease subunit [Thermoanaerobaculia bacterium]